MVHYQPAKRIASFKPYFFTRLGTKLAELKSKKVDVIRLDMGSPDLPPADFIVDALESSARRSDRHGYSVTGGIPGLRQAFAVYYGKRFGVELDPEKEILGLIGSKEGIFNLHQVMVNDGDVVLIPDPGYPVYRSGAEIAGGTVYPMPLLEENGFLPDLKQIPEHILRKTKILWINYPNNPTGAVAPLEFFREVVDFAHEHQILIAHDAPYTEISYDGYQPASILQVPNAKEVAIEFNSLSKTYNMGGWRVGVAAGNEQVLGYLSTYKSQADTSHFIPVQEAAIAALTGDQGWIEKRNVIYKERRDLVVSALRKAGLRVNLPNAAIYVWVKIPEGILSEDFCAQLLEETGVSTTPGSVYGDHGEGYLRISLVTPTERIQEAMERVVEWMHRKDFV